MKKMRIFFAAVLCFFTTSFGVWAGSPDKPLSIYLQGGVTLPTSDYSDYYKMGFNAGAGVGFSINENIEIVGRVLFNSFKPDEDEIGEGASVDGGELQPLLYGGELKLNTGNDGSNFYLLGGFGLAKTKLKKATVKVGSYESSLWEEQDESNTYICLGGGIEFGSLFIEARYVMVKLDEEGMDGEDTVNMIPISLGFKF